MTDKPTPEQIQRAKQLGGYSSSAEYGHSNWPVLTALADTIARLDAMQAERDKARADLGAIDEIVVLYGWGKPEADIGKKTVAAIAAPYRVETDPLEAEADKLMAMDQSTRVIVLSALKRGLEIGRQA